MTYGSTFITDRLMPENNIYVEDAALVAVRPRSRGRLPRRRRMPGAEMRHATI